MIVAIVVVLGVVAVAVGAFVLQQRKREREAFGDMFMTLVGDALSAETADSVADRVVKFMKASAEPLGRSGSRGHTVGVCMYLTGAVDALAQHFKLNMASTTFAVNKALRGFGLSEEEASGFCDALPVRSRSSFGKSAMTAGGRAILASLSGTDTGASGRLAVLVGEWGADATIAGVANAKI